MSDTFALELVRPATVSKAPPAPTYDMADLLVAYLEQLGVEYVFGIPGGALDTVAGRTSSSANVSDI